MKKDRLADARVLVAGASGDIGGFVVKALEAQGAKCFPVSRRTGFDLRNESEALTATLYARPDVIVHLAAESKSPGVPGHMFRDNLSIGTNLVHAAATTNAQLIVLGSYHAYQESDDLNSEEDFWRGNPTGVYAPLGTAQRAVEAMCRFYRVQHGLRYAFLVAPVMYGRHLHRENAVDKVISDLALSLDTGKLLKPLTGHPDRKMSILHISDIADAVVAAAGALNHEGPLNLASEEVHSLGTIAQTAAKALGVSADEIKFNGPDLPGVVLDGDRGREALEWDPKLSDTDGVRAEAAILKNLMEIGSEPAPAGK